MGTVEKPLQPNGIDDALRLLDLASKTRAHEVERKLRTDYRNLGELLIKSAQTEVPSMEALSAKAQKWLDAAKEKATQVSKQAAQSVDTSAKEHPWAYVGVAALAGAVLGFLVNDQLSSRKSN